MLAEDCPCRKPSDAHPVQNGRFGPRSRESCFRPVEALLLKAANRRIEHLLFSAGPASRRPCDTFVGGDTRPNMRMLSLRADQSISEPLYSAFESIIRTSPIATKNTAVVHSKLRAGNSATLEDVGKIDIGRRSKSVSESPRSATAARDTNLGP